MEKQYKTPKNVRATSLIDIPEKYFVSQELRDKLEKLGVKLKTGLSDELLELLPKEFKVPKRENPIAVNIFTLVIRYDGTDDFYIAYESKDGSVLGDHFIESDIKEALSVMVIHLLENKLMEVPK